MLTAVPHHSMGPDLLRVQRHERYHLLLDPNLESRRGYLGGHRHSWCFEPMVGQVVWRGRILDQYHQGALDPWSDLVHFHHHGWRVSIMGFHDCSSTVLISEILCATSTVSDTGRTQGRLWASRALRMLSMAFLTQFLGRLSRESNLRPA
jgi:hypothetical protein